MLQYFVRKNCCNACSLRTSCDKNRWLLIDTIESLNVTMNASTENINFLIAVLGKNGLTAVKIHEMLTNACGDVLSLRRVQEINKEYKIGKRVDCQRKEGSGRPSSSASDENVSRVKELVEEHNNCISYRAIALQL